MGPLRLVLPLVVLLLTTPALAQITLFSDDFEDGNLDGWTIGSTGCADQPHGWSVQDGVLRYEQTACGECSVLRVGDPTWKDYVVTFDVRLLAGDRVHFAVQYQDESDYVDVQLSSRSGDPQTSVSLASGQQFFGGSSSGPFTLTAWDTWGVQTYGSFLGIEKNGTRLRGTHSAPGSTGQFAFRPP